MGTNLNTTKKSKISYCQFVKNLPPNHVHKIYHDHYYGFAVNTDEELFERLVLEINQAGISWTIILNKQNNFKKAYHQFNIQKVANYTQNDINRLLNDKGIIRNKLKIEAAIYNAQQILAIQKEYGSFKSWLNHHHPKNITEWTKLFKKKFKFMGTQIVNEFLMSTAYLPGAHTPECDIFKKYQKNIIR
jgi:DNA-3-methyladenine glycosylase I